MSVSTHVLDAASGRPARGVPVRLERQIGAEWTAVGSGATDDDGRLTDLAADTPAGTYRLRLDVASYHGEQAFFPEVVIVFRIADPASHHHVPLLLSPYAYSTYRGS